MLLHNSYINVTIAVILLHSKSLNDAQGPRQDFSTCAEPDKNALGQKQKQKIMTALFLVIVETRMGHFLTGTVCQLTMCQLTNLYLKLWKLPTMNHVVSEVLSQFSERTMITLEEVFRFLIWQNVSIIIRRYYKSMDSCLMLLLEGAGDA